MSDSSNKIPLKRLSELAEPPEKLEIHKSFLMNLGAEEFFSAFRAIHKFFYKLLSDIAERPKASEGNNTAIWPYFHLLLYLFACGKDIYDDVCFGFTEIPANDYLSVTVSDPMTFSYGRAYTYICRWALENKYKICNINVENLNVPGLAKFFKLNNEEYMSVYVPYEKI